MNHWLLFLEVKSSHLTRFLQFFQIPISFHLLQGASNKHVRKEMCFKKQPPSKETSVRWPSKTQLAAGLCGAHIDGVWVETTPDIIMTLLKRR